MEVIGSRYRKLLGGKLNQLIKSKKVSKIDISFENENDVEFISPSTIIGVLSGERNITQKTATALHECLGFNSPRQVFFPDEDFCIELVTQLLDIILNNELPTCYILLRQKLKNHLSNGEKKVSSEDFVLSHKVEILNLFEQYFPTSGIKEETTTKVIQKLIPFIAELALLIP